MKILIAINNDEGISSTLSEHFGHCPYFAIYQTETKHLEIIKSSLDHSNQSLTPVDQIMKFKPELIISKGMGQRAIKLFQEKNIKVKTGNYPTIKEVLENLDNLKELTSGCNH